MSFLFIASRTTRKGLRNFTVTLPPGGPETFKSPCGWMVQITAQATIGVNSPNLLVRLPRGSQLGGTFTGSCYSASIPKVKMALKGYAEESFDSGLEEEFFNRIGKPKRKRALHRVKA